MKGVPFVNARKLLGIFDGLCAVRASSRARDCNREQCVLQIMRVPCPFFYRWMTEFLCAVSAKQACQPGNNA